jgi:hypothetical protein
MTMTVRSGGGVKPSQTNQFWHSILSAIFPYYNEQIADAEPRSRDLLKILIYSLRAISVVGVVVAATLLWSHGAWAQTGGNPSCPLGLSTPADGCQGFGAAGSVQHPNFFTGYANQNGQSYAVRPAWNVAGVDYGVGVPQASLAAVMANFVTATNYPAHGQCTFHAASWPSGSATAVPNKYPVLTCSDTNPADTIVISGYNFGPPSPSQHCVVLEIESNNQATVVIDSNNFANEYQANVNTGCNTFAELGAQVYGAAQIKLLGTGNVVFTRNTVSGQGPDNTPAVWRLQADGQYGATGLYTAIVVADNRLAGTTTMQYNAFLDANGRFWGMAYAIGDISQAWNYIEGMVLGKLGGSPTATDAYTQAHGEMTEPGPGASPASSGPSSYNVTTVYNTCLQPSTVYKDAVGNGTTTCFYLSSGGYGPGGVAGAPTITLASVTLTNNTVVTNANPAQCAAPYVGKACTANGVLSTSLWAYRAPTGTAAATVSYDAYGSINISNNFVDPSGSFFCFSYASAPVFNGPLAWSGNMDLLDGSSIAVWDGVYGYGGRTGNYACTGSLS